jgi:hypothetical protein
MGLAATDQLLIIFLHLADIEDKIGVLRDRIQDVHRI